jgi:two-component system chemotaxis response regulator CheY
MKILVVDDSKLARYQVVAVLKELGYDQITALDNIADARIALTNDRFDLILSDYNMPGGSGLDFVKMVRAEPASARVPFIMVTTVAEREKIMEAVKCGVQNYIFKPVQKRMLADKLAELAKTYEFQAPKG